MKQLVQYTSIVAFLLFSAAAQAQTQNSGFIDQNNARYKWDIIGSVDAPLTGIQAVYPNASHDMVNILLAETAYQPVDVWILNLDGTALKTLHFSPQGNLITIDLSDLPAGEYALHVKEAGREVQRLKLIRRD